LVFHGLGFAAVPGGVKAAAEPLAALLLAATVAFALAQLL
jgi:hypothetical protein